jgi:hypothetical protein
LATRTSIQQFTLLADALGAESGFGSTLVLAVAPIQNKTEFIDRRNPPKYRVLEALLPALQGKPYASRIAYVDWRSLLLWSRMRAGEDLLPDPMFFHCEANVDLTCFDGEGRLYAWYEAIRFLHARMHGLPGVAHLRWRLRGPRLQAHRCVPEALLRSPARRDAHGAAQLGAHSCLADRTDRWMHGYLSATAAWPTSSTRTCPPPNWSTGVPFPSSRCF